MVSEWEKISFGKEFLQAKKEETATILTKRSVREEPDVFSEAEQEKYPEVVVNLKNPTRDWIERTTEVFSRESERLHKPRRRKGASQEEVPNRGTVLTKRLSEESLVR